MEVEYYSHVLHLVSTSRARLRPDLDALDALRGVFPAGHALRRAEGPRDGAHRRAGGRAARAVRRRRRLPRLRRQHGHGITIRTVVLRDGRAYVHTGAGIVAGSVPEKEFEETEHKAAALRRAIEERGRARRRGAPHRGPSTAEAPA